jgi:hypothetical protein
MSQQGNLHCIYCDNPNPNIRYQNGSNRSLSINLGFISGSYGDSSTFQRVPRINCNLCHKNYSLIANSTEKDFLDEILKRISYSETFIGAMNVYDLDLPDISDGFMGIAEPHSFLNGLRKKISYSGDCHIVFQSDRIRYFITCGESNGRKIALNLEALY